MRTVRTPNILPVHSVNVLDGMSIVYVFHILLGSKNFLIFYPFMYILVAYPEHPHGMRDANIPLYIPGISLGWRVLVGNMIRYITPGPVELRPVIPFRKQVARVNEISKNGDST